MFVCCSPLDLRHLGVQERSRCSTGIEELLLEPSAYGHLDALFRKVPAAVKSRSTTTTWPSLDSPLRIVALMQYLYVDIVVIETGCRAQFKLILGG